MSTLFNRIKTAGFLLLPVFFIMACATSADKIPADLSPAELIQRAQEASDHNRYRVALQYYQVLLDRNQDSMDMVCTGEYEIAFIHYKQKKYSQAKEQFHALLERYDTPDAELLPPQFKRLATIVLDRIAEKEKPFKLFGKK